MGWLFRIVRGPGFCIPMLASDKLHCRPPLVGVGGDLYCEVVSESKSQREMQLWVSIWWFQQLGNDCVDPQEGNWLKDLSIYYTVQNDLPLAKGSFPCRLMSFDMIHWFCITFLLSGKIHCRLIWYITWTRTGMSHFSKEFFKVRNGIYRPQNEC